MEASCLRLVLASTDVADLGLAQKILIAKRVGDVSVCQSHSEVMALLAQRHEEGVATVIIAQGPVDQGDDAVDAVRMLQTIPASQARIAATISGHDDAVLRQLVQLGALDILQSPISEQADQLSFLAAKWRHMLQKKQPTADIAADFSAGCGDPAPQGFCLDMANLPPLVPPLEDPLEELLGPGSATSCGTALHWDESDELAQSILPGLFGEDTDIGASPFDMIDFGEPNKGAHGQPSEVEISGSSENSVAHLPSFSRQTSLTTCLSGKRKVEEMSEHSRGASCDTTRASDLMDDARCKKQKVEWTAELDSFFSSVVESIGVDQAVPSQILSGMGTAGKGLTRQNIASHRRRSRPNSMAGVSASMPAPLPPRTAPAPQPVPGVPLLPAGSRQLPAMLPGTLCWALGGIAQPPPMAWAAWPAAAVLPPFPPPPAPMAPTQPSPAFLASLQQAISEPAGKLPLGLRLDADAVLSSWKSGAGC